MSTRVPAVILGGTGYVAGELLRLLAVHPYLDLAAIASDSQPDEQIARFFHHLAPVLPISVTVRNEDNEFPARAAGATTVINPVSFAGLLHASSCTGQHLADYLMDLASIHGEVALAEPPVACASAEDGAW